MIGGYRRWERKSWSWFQTRWPRIIQFKPFILSHFNMQWIFVCPNASMIFFRKILHHGQADILSMNPVCKLLLILADFTNFFRKCNNTHVHSLSKGLDILENISASVVHWAISVPYFQGSALHRVLHYTVPNVCFQHFIIYDFPIPLL